MTTDAISLRSVSRTYGRTRSRSTKRAAPDTTVTALDNVTLTFPRATFTAVMGPSGSCCVFFRTSC